MTTKEYKALPSAAAGLSISTPTSAWGYSSYGTITSSLTSGIYVTGVAVLLDAVTPTVDTTFEAIVEIYKGPSDTLVAQIPVAWRIDTTAEHVLPRVLTIPEPVFIEAGVQVRCRIADSSTSAFTHTAVKINYYESASPTVTLSSPSDGGSTSDTTPDLVFTGTDPDGEDIEYEVRLNDLPFENTDIRSSASNSSTTGTAISVSAPSGVVANDVVIVVIHGNGQTTIVDNNGSTPFTEDVNDYQPNTTGGQTVSVFSRRIVSGDPSTYNFTLGTSGRWAITAVAIKNPHPTSIYDVAPSTSNAANRDDSTAATLNAPSITTNYYSALDFVCGFSDDGAGGAMSPPAGYTTQGNPTNQPLIVATKLISNPVATGTRTVTGTTSAPMIALSFAVRNNGASDNAFDFEEASSQRITYTPNTTSYPSKVSLSFWFKPESLPGAHQMHFVDLGSSSNWNPRHFGAYWTPASGGQVGISWINSSGPTYSEWTASYTLTVGNIYHFYYEIDWTVNPNTAKLWINGSSVTLTNTFGTNYLIPTGTFDQLSVGGEHGSGTTGNYVDGLLSDILIWSDNVGSTRASGLYNSGNGARGDILYPTNLTENIRLRVDASNAVGGGGTLLNAPVKTSGGLYTHAIINAVSGVDSGFSGSPDNTSPFTSGQQVTYTVQSALSDAAYYWRVRARDPSGSNAWGAWSSTRSFTVSTTPTTFIPIIIFI